MVGTKLISYINHMNILLKLYFFLLLITPIPFDLFEFDVYLNSGFNTESKYYWEREVGPGSKYYWEREVGPSIIMSYPFELPICIAISKSIGIF